MDLGKRAAAGIRNPCEMPGTAPSRSKDSNPRQEPGKCPRERGRSGMEASEILGKVKEIIAHVGNLKVAQIDDGADLRDDLNLDSLSLLEIGVDIDYAFQLGIPDLENRLAKLRTLPEVVELVQKLS